MRDLRIGGAFALLAAAMGLTYITPHVERSSHSSLTYPTTACSGLSAEGTTTAVLASSKTAVHPISTKSMKFFPAKTNSYPLKNQPLLIEGNLSTSLLTAASAGHWIGVTTCSAGSGDEWFAGGSGEVTSKSRLDLVNSGLSAASVELSAYTAHQSVVVSTVSVNANSSAAISLDTLALGESSVVVHVVARSGRISAFLFDERTKGLSSLGMDYVNPAPMASTAVTIPAVLGSAGKNRSVSHFLRILAPGNLDANIKVTIVSVDGDYIPLGFDDRTLAHGHVFDLPLTSVSETKPFGIKITSDQPIVAGVRSQLSGTGSVDFAWATAAPDLVASTLNIGGSAPLFVFVGEKISVGISWQGSAGGTGRQTVTGDQIVYWQAPTNLRKVQLSPMNSGIKGELVFLSSAVKNYGLSYLPIASALPVEANNLPILDAHVISRG